MNNFENYLVELETGESLNVLSNFTLTSFDSTRELLVFNYGLACNFSHWEKQAPYFDSLGYQVLLYDYRGHFKSTNNGGLNSCTFENYVKDLHALLNQLNCKKPILLGHSMGVNIVLEYVLQYPEKSSSIIIISGTVLSPRDYMFDSNMFEFIMPLLEAANSQFPNIIGPIWKNSFKIPIIRKIVHDGGFHKQKTDQDFVKNYIKKIGELPAELFFQMFDQMHKHKILNRLHEIKNETLVITGDQDKVIPSYLQKVFLKYMKNSELYLIREGSHVPQVDFPDLVNKRIEIFLIKNNHLP